jgi:hypothetical protein
VDPADGIDIGAGEHVAPLARLDHQILVADLLP